MFNYYSSEKEQKNREHIRNFRLTVFLITLTPWILMVLVRGVYTSLNPFLDTSSIRLSIFWSTISINVGLIHYIVNFDKTRNIERSVSEIQHKLYTHDFIQAVQQLKNKVSSGNEGTDQANLVIDTAYNLLTNFKSEYIEKLNEHISFIIHDADLHIVNDYEGNNIYAFLRLRYPEMKKRIERKLWLVGKKKFIN